MTDSPYGPQASHRLDGDVPESGAHPPAVSGQIVPAGAYDPAGRSQDPLSPGRADAPAPGAGCGARADICVVEAPKRVGVAFVLAFCFGCFGMFYSTVPGALVLIAVATGLVVIALVLSFLLAMATLGFGAFTVGL